MHLAILSRNKNQHSIRRLLAEAAKLGVKCDVINPLECQLVIDGKRSCILVNSNPIPTYDGVLPRIGASITNYGLAVVKHFETMGIYTVNSSRSIAESRDKMRALQVMTNAQLQMPPTSLTRSTKNLKGVLEAVKGLPVVLKVLQGTQGVGVMLVHTPVSMRSVLDTMHSLDQDVIIQQFIAEGAGRDYRAFVIGGKVVAAMMRTAPEGEFRSNIHRGGEGRLVRLPRSFQRAAVRAAQVFNLQIAGVDLMESSSGPMVIEVNSSPGFEGIERATGMNVAAMIIRHICAEARKRKRRISAAKARAKASRGKAPAGARGRGRRARGRLQGRRPRSRGRRAGRATAA